MEAATDSRPMFNRCSGPANGSELMLRCPRSRRTGAAGPGPFARARSRAMPSSEIRSSQEESAAGEARSPAQRVTHAVAFAAFRSRGLAEAHTPSGRSCSSPGGSDVSPGPRNSRSVRRRQARESRVESRQAGHRQLMPVTWCYSFLGASIVQPLLEFSRTIKLHNAHLAHPQPPAYILPPLPCLLHRRTGFRCPRRHPSFSPTRACSSPVFLRSPHLLRSRASLLTVHYCHNNGM